jgi:hypothetical protein
MVKIASLFIMAMLVFAAGAARAQNAAQTGKQTKGVIAAIRAEVTLINKSAKKYKKTVTTVEGISLEGAEAAYFATGRGLKKITARIYGETYNATAELYYQGEQMIFAYYVFRRYDTQVGMTPPPKVVRTEVKRLYFSDEKLIRLLEGKKAVKAGEENFKDTEKEFLDLSAKLKEAYLPSISN